MQYSLHIPFVNREDLLKQAVESLRDIGNIHVWADGVPAPNVKAEVHTLPQMPFTAVMNSLIKYSLDNNDDVLFFAHNDCLALPGVARQLLKHVGKRFAHEPKWGAIFTTYDVLAAFNCQALRETGWFDCLFNWYVSDVDYYRRMTLAGWPIEQLSCGVIHVNDASNTIKADPELNARTQIRATKDREMYRYKWGGEPGQECYIRPYEGAEQQ